MMLHFLTSILCIALVSCSPFPNNSSVGIDSRIYNGYEAILGDFPWQAGILITTSSRSFRCGGAIYTPQWIITSAYCVSGALSAEIYTGSLQWGWGGVSMADRFIWPSSFDLNNKVADIGLIHLSEPLGMNVKIHAIIIAESYIESGIGVTESGWGSISQTSTPGSQVLNFAPLNTVNNTDCEAVYRETYNSSIVLCAKSGTFIQRGSCNGDFGNPLVVNFTTGSPKLVGVNIFHSYNCQEGSPSGYTRLAYYREFIREQTGN